MSVMSTTLASNRIPGQFRPEWGFCNISHWLPLPRSSALPQISFRPTGTVTAHPSGCSVKLDQSHVNTLGITHNSQVALEDF